MLKTLKIQRPLKNRRAILGPRNYMDLIELCKTFLEWSWWTFWHLYFLRYYSNLVSMRNSLNANNCWRRQNYENCPTWPFIFDVLSEYVIHFVSNPVSLAVENVVNFTLNDFSRKRSCVSMRNYAKTWMYHDSYDMTHKVFV